MREDPIFSDWKPEFAELWGRVSLKIRHRLADHPLFSEGSIARLIETYPREHYQLMQPAAVAGGTSRDGYLGGISGEAALESIAKGRMWINLRNVAEVDPRFGALTRDIFDELRQRLPSFRPLTETIGILVSSPNNKTHYHADLPGQALWQIRGRKRVYLYPPTEPFLTREQIERITISRKEFIAYESWYDDHAEVIDLEPGDMIHWPLNAPHRVDNHDCLNVSMTMEFFTPEIRRRHIVNRANAIMRIMGMQPKSVAIFGASYAAKALLQRALRNTAMVRKRDEMAIRRPSFRLDPTRPNAIAELRG